MITSPERFSSVTQPHFYYSRASELSHFRWLLKHNRIGHTLEFWIPILSYDLVLLIINGKPLTYTKPP